jgi:hypothetical protein
MPSRLPELRAEPTTALDGFDVVLGVVAVASGTVRVARKALVPSFLPEPLRPASVLAAGLRPLGRHGRLFRERLTVDAMQRYDLLLPMVVDHVLRRLRLTDLVRRYVDLDALVAGVDLDAIAERLDVQAVVGRVDLDEVAGRLDVEAVLDRLDLTATVLERVDLRQVVDAVVTRVDLQEVVDAVLTRVDLTAIVSQVLDEIDLAELIRESTGTMASDTVQSVRMRGVSADELVSRSAARLLPWRSRPRPDGTTPR